MHYIVSWWRVQGELFAPHLVHQQSLARPCAILQLQVGSAGQLQAIVAVDQLTANVHQHDNIDDDAASEQPVASRYHFPLIRQTLSLFFAPLGTLRADLLINWWFSVSEWSVVHDADWI